MSEIGKRIAREMNIPEKLIKDGEYKNWTIEYAIDTLAKMASLDTDSPSKSSDFVTPANNAIKSLKQPSTKKDDSEDSIVQTPINSQSLKPPKRRLH